MSKNMEKFVGRERELNELNRFLRKQTASLIVVRGRRRVGKSRLIEEFAKDMRFLSFAGLVPNKDTTAQSQRDEFMRQFSEKTNFPEVIVDDWSKVFSILNEELGTDRVVLLFDEISWMGSEDADFLAKIKDAWDTKFKKNTKLIFIICGSASYWIEENILSNTGFLGRISYTLTLEELPLRDCANFWFGKSKHFSAFEKFKLFSITGGIPRYLEEIDTSLSAEENIRNLCFKKGGVLVNEFENIFSNTFKRNTEMYRKIVRTLINGPLEATQISDKLGSPLSGLFSEYLQELCLAGFVKREYTWQIKSGDDTKLSQYRLSDNYVRFYLKYIEPNLSKIDKRSFQSRSVTDLSEWSTIMGLQFENLVLNNRHFIFESLHLNLHEIINDNPYFQHASTKQRGCQIDYMIQTKHGVLYICEVKFSKSQIGSEVINELEYTINNITCPKGLSFRPVLIHVNGVTDAVIESDYFAHIIDMSKIL